MKWEAGADAGLFKLILHQWGSNILHYRTWNKEDTVLEWQLLNVRKKCINILIPSAQQEISAVIKKA